MEFSEILNKYMELLSCTSKDISSYSGLSETVISRYKNGNRTPKDKETIDKIVDAIKKISEEKNIEIDSKELLDDFNIIRSEEDFMFFLNNFNKLIKEDRAIIMDEPGITRDRIYGTVNYNDKSFLLIDTGGIDLGNDDFNIEAALELRMQFERNGLHPSVNAIVQEIGDDITEGAINFKKQKYDINFIGSDEESYSASSILGSKLEEEAKIAHVAYSQTRGQVADAIYEFYMYEYNYLSSCATVIHRRAKKHCNIPGMDVPPKERTKFQKDTIELLEHKRWNAWIRSKGYIWSGSINKSSRNDLGKKHHDIVPYAELTDDEKRKDGLVSF